VDQQLITMVKPLFLTAPFVLIFLQTAISFPMPSWPTWKGIKGMCFRLPAWPLSLVYPQVSVFTKEQPLIQRGFFYDKDLPSFVEELETKGYINPNRRVIFVVHGYMWNVFTTWPEDMAESLINLKDEDNMVITIHWYFGGDFDFPEATANTQTVSDFVSKFALAILNSKSYQGDKDKLYLHCIGHSLGAQVCGQSGRKAPIFDRVTGLDPAGPGFEKCTDHWNVDKDSADCVDNIHTDGSKDGRSWWNPLSVVVSHFGSMKEWGHYDFYPNNGTNQPGCDHLYSVWWCSHNRAIDLFMDTIPRGPDVCPVTGCINPDGTPCTDLTNHMGYYSSCHIRNKDKKEQTKFTLTTKDAKPFC